jgi:hypothetical protein
MGQPGAVGGADPDRWKAEQRHDPVDVSVLNPYNAGFERVATYGWVRARVSVRRGALQ